MTEFLIMNGQKIICLKVENVTWLDSLNYLVMPLRTLPQAFGLTAEKSCYPHLFHTAENMKVHGIVFFMCGVEFMLLYILFIYVLIVCEPIVVVSNMIKMSSKYRA